MSKKKLFCVILLVLLLSHIVFVIVYRANPTAEYIYDENDNIVSVRLKDEIYIASDFELRAPHNYVHNGNWFELKSYFVPCNDISDFLLMWDTASFYSEKFDKDKNFLRCDIWGRTSDDLYVKEDFIYPTIYENEVSEVWMSHSSDNEDNIKDIETVAKIVECAKSDGKIELDKYIYDYIKKYSADYHCLWLKYEGYPIIEEFHIKETEEGKYIIKQFTPEEYNTVYYDDELHYKH